MLDPSKRRFVIIIKMFLIPFIRRTKINVQIIYVFLNKGKMFLQEENIDDFLEINSIYSKNTIIDNDYCYIEIDTIKTDMSLFYTYNENSNVECWRRFILIDNDEFHINSTNPEFIQPVLKKIIEL
jgi:hypothetical protein